MHSKQIHLLNNLEEIKWFGKNHSLGTHAVQIMYQQLKPWQQTTANQPAMQTHLPIQ